MDDKGVKIQTEKKAKRERKAMKKVKQIVKQVGETKRGTRVKTFKLKLKSGAGDGTRTRDSLLGGHRG